MSLCIEVQERIALGQSLTAPHRSHVSTCKDCSLVAEIHSLLDASLETLAERVPDGFADRVMIRLASHEPVAVRRWSDASWFELALANVAFVCALLNTVRFVAGVLIPSVSLGATP